VCRPKIAHGADNRLRELTWIVRNWEEVESDMSMFHRVDDSPAYPHGPRWFARAERLALYPGAVRAAAQRQAQERQPEFGEDLPAVPAGAVFSDELGVAGYGTVIARDGTPVDPQPLVINGSPRSRMVSGG
jgi:hypothetical protein